MQLSLGKKSSDPEGTGGGSTVAFAKEAPAQVITPRSSGIEKDALKERISTLARDDWLEYWQGFFIRNFLLFGLAVVIVVSLVWPVAGVTLMTITGGHATHMAVFVIFFVSGFSLTHLRSWSWEQFRALTLGMVLVLIVTPMLGFAVLAWSPMTKLLTQGTALFCVVPTTLSNGVVLVSQAGGHVPLAILITLTTNIISVVTMPFFVEQIFRTTVSIDPKRMCMELALLVTLPLCLGILVQRSVPRASAFYRRWKTQLSMVCSTCVCILVWVIYSEAHDKVVNTPGKDMVLCLAVSLGCHAVFLVACSFSAWGFRLPTAEFRTVTLMGSEKALAVAVSVLAALPDEMQSQVGVLAIPCVVGHAVRLVANSALVGYWAYSNEEEEESKERLPLVRQGVRGLPPSMESSYCASPTEEGSSGTSPQPSPRKEWRGESGGEGPGPMASRPEGYSAA